MFNSSEYGSRVGEILALDGAGERLMPLAHCTCSSQDAYRILKAASPRELFPGSRAPEMAMAGLWLYFSCLDEAHTLAQAEDTPDGSFWHGIMHRQEPDAGNSAYWFRRVGATPSFPPYAKTPSPSATKAGLPGTRSPSSMPAKKRAKVRMEKTNS